MNSMLISLAVVGVFLAFETVLGFRFGGKGKPYNKAALILHIILSLFIIAGLTASILKIHGLIAGRAFFLIALHLGLLAMLVNIITGVIMTVSKKDAPKLVLAHKIATFIMALSVIASAIFTFIRF